MTNKEKNSIIKQLIENFNFDLVHKAMVIADWTWLGNKESPSINRLRACARELIKKLLDNNCGSVRTGGFTAEKEDGGYSLYFTLGTSYASLKN